MHKNYIGRPSIRAGGLQKRKEVKSTSSKSEDPTKCRIDILPKNKLLPALIDGRQRRNYMDIKILGSVAVLSFFANILASLIAKAARDCFHRNVAHACAVIVIISGLVFFLSLALFLLTLIWR